MRVINRNKWRFLSRLVKNRYTDRLAGVIRHWPEVLLGVFSFLRLLRLRVDSKTVLLVEPNPYHSEILPGFCKYFQDLGYEVVVFCRHANVRDDAFCRSPARPRRLVFSPTTMRWALRRRKVGSFDFVLFTSNQFFSQDVRFWGEYIVYLGFVPRPRYGVFYVEHTFHPERKGLVNDTRDLFLLTSDCHNGLSLPMLNPHYFGDVKQTSLNKGKRIFISVGGITSKNRNTTLLFDAVRELEKRYAFEVWLVGFAKESSLLESLPGSVRILGRLPFEEMFQCIEKSDFFLPLLDPANDSQRRYLRGKSSGSRQLILGFAKVPVIHSAFAKAYGFSERDSILHGEGGFAEAMERALALSEDEYASRRKGLQALAAAVYQESLANLDRCLKAHLRTPERDGPR